MDGAAVEALSQLHRSRFAGEARHKMHATDCVELGIHCGLIAHCFMSLSLRYMIPVSAATNGLEATERMSPKDLAPSRAVRATAIASPLPDATYLTSFSRLRRYSVESWKPSDSSDSMAISALEYAPRSSSLRLYHVRSVDRSPA